MADREELLRLASLAEQASGPDRELDGAIDRLLHKRPKDGDYDAAERAIWRVTDEWSGLLVRGDGFARDSFCADEFTASIDAAMLLVPEGMQFGAGRDNIVPGPEGWAWVSGDDDTQIVRSATPALALAAAGLRARAQDPLRAHGGGE